MWCPFFITWFFGLDVFSDEMKRPKHDIKRQTRWTRPIYHSFLLFYFFLTIFFGIVYVFILKFACVRHKQHNKHEHHLNVFDCRAQNNFSAATISHASNQATYLKWYHFYLFVKTSVVIWFNAILWQQVAFVVNLASKYCAKQLREFDFLHVAF